MLRTFNDVLTPRQMHLVVCEIEKAIRYIQELPVMPCKVNGEELFEHVAWNVTVCHDTYVGIIYDPRNNNSLYATYTVPR
jgi:hypothetical protein